MSGDAERKDRQQLVITALASLLVLSLVALLVVTLLWRTDDSGSESGSGAAALVAAGKGADKAARSAVTAMTTYDYKSVEEDFGWVDQAGTAKFRRQYAEVSAPIKELVVNLKAKAVGTVVASAPDVQDADHVTVLLFVDQVLTNPGSGSTPAQRGVDQPRVTMKMVRQGDRWLVDEVQLSSLDEASR